MTETEPEITDLDALLDKLMVLRREIRDEYLKPHSKPWIIGFSGGKDSTLLAHFVIECILSVPPDERHRAVHIVSNDTLVESPIFQGFVDRLLARMTESIAALQIPVSVVKTSPIVEETFWVNLLGKGYPAPNRTFRWCTDRMKIRPTTRFIREQVARNGEVILLLGVRSAESASRAANMAKHAARSVDDRLSPHADLPGCFVFSPIKDLTTAEVWIMLLQSRPPWGGTYHEVVTRYLVTVRQNAGGVKKGRERQEELDKKLEERKQLNDRIAKLQGDHVQLENEKEDRERERRQLTEDLARMGGAGARDAAAVQAEYVKAEQTRTDAEKDLADAVRSLGLSLSVARLGLPIRNRLKAEELLESWEGLKRGRLDNKEKVLAAALPEPPDTDPILGHLDRDARGQLRERFSLALERIYNPPPPNCAAEYLLGHVKGEMRAKALLQLNHIQTGGSARIRSAAKRVRDGREAFDEVSARKERLQNLPQETKEMSDRLGAREAWKLLKSDRELFESYYRKAREAFEAMRKQAGTV